MLLWILILSLFGGALVGSVALAVILAEGGLTTFDYDFQFANGNSAPSSPGSSSAAPAAAPVTIMMTVTAFADSDVASSARVR